MKTRVIFGCNRKILMHWNVHNWQRSTRMNVLHGMRTMRIGICLHLDTITIDAVANTCLPMFCKRLFGRILIELLPFAVFECFSVWFLFVVLVVLVVVVVGAAHAFHLDARRHLHGATTISSNIMQLHDNGARIDVSILSASSRRDVNCGWLFLLFYCVLKCRLRSCRLTQSPKCFGNVD